MSIEGKKTAQINTAIEIVGVLETVKHQVLFDDAIESVEWAD